MTPQDGMQLLSRSLNHAVKALEAAGYVVSGEITFIKPQVRIVETVAVGYIGENNMHRLQLQTRKLAPVFTDGLVTLESATKGLEAAQRYMKPVSSGEICPQCGQTMQRTGSCYTCGACGHTGGCG